MYVNIHKTRQKETIGQRKNRNTIFGLLLRKNNIPEGKSAVFINGCSIQLNLHTASSF